MQTCLCSAPLCTVTTYTVQEPLGAGPVHGNQHVIQTAPSDMPVCQLHLDKPSLRQYWEGLDFVKMATKTNYRGYPVFRLIGSHQVHLFILISLP